MIICYHDDFDGLASAALLNAFLKRTEDPTELHVMMPVNYHMKEDWLKPTFFSDNFKDKIAIVDFQYHPEVTYYFDHHGTAFLTPDYRAHYDQRVPEVIGNPSLFWSPTYGSCGRLIFEHLAPHWDDVEQYRELADAADMIDQARYPSVESYFEAKDPAIAVNHAYRRLTTGQKSELIRQLDSQTLAQVLGGIKELADGAIQENRNILQKYEAITEINGIVAFTNLWSTDLPFLRYAPYYYHPSSRYAVTIFFPSSTEAAISIARNPWKKGTYEINLSEIAQTYGGGGHSYAAGISFTQHEYENPHQVALKVAMEIVGKLNLTPEIRVAA